MGGSTIQILEFWGVNDHGTIQMRFKMRDAFQRSENSGKQCLLRMRNLEISFQRKNALEMWFSELQSCFWVRSFCFEGPPQETWAQKSWIWQSSCIRAAGFLDELSGLVSVKVSINVTKIRWLSCCSLTRLALHKLATTLVHYKNGHISKIIERGIQKDRI